MYVSGRCTNWGALKSADGQLLGCNGNGKLLIVGWLWSLACCYMPVGRVGRNCQMGIWVYVCVCVLERETETAEALQQGTHAWGHTPLCSVINQIKKPLLIWCRRCSPWFNYSYKKQESNNSSIATPLWCRLFHYWLDNKGQIIHSLFKFNTRWGRNRLYELMSISFKAPQNDLCWCCVPATDACVL